MRAKKDLGPASLPMAEFVCSISAGMPFHESIRGHKLLLGVKCIVHTQAVCIYFIT